MKKVLCALLSIIIFILSISVSFPAAAQEVETEQIENFSENGIEMIQKYDKDKNFKAVDETTDELDYLQFQTARLFVKCSSKFDELGAEDIVSGFENWHILQYASPAEAKKAYSAYKQQKEIESVEPDVPLDVELDETNIFSEYGEDSCSEVSPTALVNPVYVTKEEFENDCSKTILGTNDVLKYISDNDIKTSEIVVGVIDSGIDYTHEIFENRYIKTDFNSTNSGTVDSEYEAASDSHGTSTASCIVSTTPSSVKVSVYKATANGGDFDTKLSWIFFALLEAYNNKCDIVNMSLSFSPVSEAIKSILQKMKDEDITVFVSADNLNALVPYGNSTSYLFHNENVTAVGSTDKMNRGAGFSNKGFYVAFNAPGKDVAVAVPQNKYVLRSGTSFSCPFAVGIFATLKTLNSGFSNEKIIDLMKYTCADVFDAFNNDEVWYGRERYGAGILDAWRAFSEMEKISLVSNVEFSMPTGECNTGDKLMLSCSDNCEIYYTTDLTPANRENGIKYSEPITITESMVVNAVAYDKNGNRGQNKFEYYIAFEMGNENDFIIDDNGIITGYLGEIRNLEIPKTVNGKTVTGFHKDLFSGECECEGVIPAKNSATAIKLPETIEYLQCDTWFTDIEFFSAPGLKEIPDYGFSSEGRMLQYVNLPKVEKVGLMSFSYLEGIRELYLPNCTEIHDMAFEGTKIYHLYLPKLKYFYDGFLTNASVTILYCPELEKGFAENDPKPTLFHNVDFTYQLFLPKIKSITFNSLDCDSLRRVELPEIESLLQFPKGKVFGNANCKLVLPLSLKEISVGYQKNNTITYTIYGTKGSYTEAWAKENNIEFIELKQETAIYTDVRETCNDYTETLLFDSLGFHKEYQWYGSYDNSTENGIAISGADKELFNIHDYKSYPYYYCVCTSTDIGDGRQQVEKIYSKVCRNTDYCPADYSAYDLAVSKANSLERNNYIDLTMLDDALSVDVSGLSVAEQAVVDAQTKAIEDALQNLELKAADYTKVKKAIESVPEDLSKYTDESVSVLQGALDSVDYSLDITQQKKADDYAEAITNAIYSLKLKSANPSTIKPTDEPQDKTDNSKQKTNQVKQNNSMISPHTGGEGYSAICVAALTLSSSAALLILQNKRKKKR